MSDKIDCTYLARSPTSQPFVHDQGAELRIPSVVVCNQCQLALFAHVRSHMSDKIDRIYPPRPPTRAPFVDDQGAELSVSTVMVY